MLIKQPGSRKHRIPRVLSDTAPYAVKQELAIRQIATTTEKSRGRFETRTVTTTTNVIDECYLHWPGSKQIIRFERRTSIKGKVTSTTTYAITSLPRAKADAAYLLKHLCGRWLIESRFHILDTQLGEDHCHARTGCTPHGLSAIRHSAVNLAGILRLSTTHMCFQPPTCAKNTPPSPTSSCTDYASRLSSQPWPWPTPT